METLSTSQLAAISRLFSSAVFREMARGGRSAMFARLFGQAGVRTRCSKNTTVADVFDSAFSILKVEGLRDEYIYRAAITHKILMGKHSLRTACMLTEFRAGSCKADLVILNGTATAYEIKSERDSLSRISNQVANYRKVFARVNVIAHEAHLEGVLESVHKDVGILSLSRRFQITTVREATDRADQICPETVFDSLRINEACEILNHLGIPIPEVPNTKRYSTLRAIFAGIDPVAVHMGMVSTLKRTRDLAPLGDLVHRLPKSLHAAALSIQVRPIEQERLVKALATPIWDALSWG